MVTPGDANTPRGSRLSFVLSRFACAKAPRRHPRGHCRRAARWLAMPGALWPLRLPGGWQPRRRAPAFGMTDWLDFRDGSALHRLRRDLAETHAAARRCARCLSPHTWHADSMHAYMLWAGVAGGGDAGPGCRRPGRRRPGRRRPGCRSPGSRRPGCRRLARSSGGAALSAAGEVKREAATGSGCWRPYRWPWTLGR